jgi:N-acetylmuramidase
MNFKGKAKRIEDIDLPLIGAEIGVGEDEVHAILDVESAGSGFDKQGRPKMLFEPHIFWRELGPGEKRDKAAKAGLAYGQWKRNYPPDSYARLEKAMAIDENAALRSASWGLGQILGLNSTAAGYPSARAMVEAFMDDEDAHLRAMIRFIKAHGLDDELRRHDWKGFARGYNGAGFAKNGYDRKLAQAFAKWQRIKDTPVKEVNPVVTRSAPRITPAKKPVQATKPAPSSSIKETGKSAAGGLLGGGVALGVVALWDQIKAFLGKVAAFYDALTPWN